MSRIEKRFESLKAKGEKALVAFITAGDPDMEATQTLFKKIEEQGADLIELGVPFSDPLADGPVIQAASQRSLDGGTTLKKIIVLVKEIRKTSQLPIILMSSFNPVYVYGEEAFVRDAVSAGVDGVILPDLPPEEAGDFLALADAKGLDMIMLMAPTTSEARVQMISEKSRGFIYYISVTGTTGTRNKLSEGIRTKVEAICKATSLPVLVGFGISGPEQAEEAVQFSDGVIVGSSIVKIIAGEEPLADRVEKVGQLVSDIKRAISSSQ
jgi:tryptophan synthase alpha chain